MVFEGIISTPTKSDQRKVPKRLRSPARRFVASPSNRSAKRAQFNFKDIELDNNESIDLLSRNLFDVPSTPVRRNNSEIVSDRFIPCRSTNFDDALGLMNENKPFKEETETLYGVIGHDKATPPTQTSNTSSNGSPSRNDNGNTFNSLIRDELLGHMSQRTPLNKNQMSPKTPVKQQSHSLFRYNAIKKTCLEFNNISATHTMSPLTSFTSLEKYTDLYSTTVNGARKINKHPFKILDAPALKDDYYLNLVDWSSNNLLAVALGSAVYLWNATTTKVELLVDIDPDAESSLSSDLRPSVTSVSWSQDGNSLAFGTKSGAIQVWDIHKRKKIRNLEGHTARVGSLGWSSSLLASGSRDKTIHRRDARVGDSTVSKLVGHKQEVCGLKWSFDFKQLASGGNDNKLFIWDDRKEEHLWKFNEAHQAAVKAVAWSPHENGLLATGGGTADRCIKFWNTITGTTLNSLDTGSQVCNLMWSKSVNEIVSTHGYSLNHMIVWKYPSMSKVAVRNGHTCRVLYLAMSPDGQTVVTGAGDERLCFWNLFPSSKGKSRSGHTPLFPKSYDIR